MTVWYDEGAKGFYMRLKVGPYQWWRRMGCYRTWIGGGGVEVP